MTTVKEKTGSGQSKDTTGTPGKSPEINSKKKGCGEVIRGIDAIARYVNMNSMQIHDLVTKYDMPVTKEKAVWCLDVDEFQSWCRDMGWTPEKPTQDLARAVFRKRLQAAGPGVVIRGSINALEKKLNKSMSTLMDLMRTHESCPIEKLPDGQYSVGENEWILFLMDVTPPKRAKREIPQW